MDHLCDVFLLLLYLFGELLVLHLQSIDFSFQPFDYFGWISVRYLLFVQNLLDFFKFLVFQPELVHNGNISNHLSKSLFVFDFEVLDEGIHAVQLTTDCLDSALIVLSFGF